MELQTIRAEIDSPGWLDRLTSQYKRDHAENLRKADQKRERELEQLAEKITAKLGKQETTPQTTEVEKPTPTENKVDEKSVLELIKEIVEILNSHTEAIESLADKIDEISGVQATRPTGRAPIVHSEPSLRDLEIVEMRATEMGLCGEIRKIIRDPYIQGRFSG